MADATEPGVGAGIRLPLAQHTGPRIGILLNYDLYTVFTDCLEFSRMTHTLHHRNWTWLAVLALCSMVPSSLAADEAAESANPRPNILWLTTEDLSPVLGCYGDQYAMTPNIDQLAGRGVRYSHAFAMASVCTPARSCLITGVYSSAMGTQHLRGEQPLSSQIRCFTEYLRDAGYYCTNNVKEDYNFPTPRNAWDESSGTAHWRKRKPGQPFFSVFNFMTTHQSRIRFTEEQFATLAADVPADQLHDPAQAPLPPYYPDTPIVRRDVARLYDLVTVMDLQVKRLLDQLEEDGLADNTIVFFYSDHGTGLPRGKRWLHDSGTRVPLIIHCPERYQHLAPGKAGTVTDRMVSFVDFAPTVLSLLGIEIPDYMQGRAFLGDQAGPPRDYVFAIRDRVDEVFEMSRMVRDHRYQYIRNYMPHRPVMQHSDFSEQTRTRQEMRRLKAAGELTGAAKDFLSETKPFEELYDTAADPHEIKNLAESPEHAEILDRLREQLHLWMVRIRDTALIPEVEMIARSAGGSPYDLARDSSKFDVQVGLGAAEAVGRRNVPLDRLLAGLKNSDAAVRFWAATALAERGIEAEPAAESLAAALADPAPNVRFAAAEAMCRMDREADTAIEVLSAGLDSEDPVTRLYAAMTLVAVGQKAATVTDQMNKTLEREPNKGTYSLYIRWALQYALKNVGR